MGLIDLPGKIVGGDIRWRGESIVHQSLAGRAGPRGTDITTIFQEPQAALNPLMTVGAQIVEVLRRHKGMSRRAARDRAIELLTLVGIPRAGERIDAYPHEFSGGMNQRVMMAIALATDPQLLVADEPTTALDVTIQAQILSLLVDLQAKLGLSVLFITHDLGVVRQLCNRVAVMYAGELVETGPAEAFFRAPAHPYSRALLKATPSASAAEKRLWSLPGSPPSLIHPPPGCRFAPRCSRSTPECTDGRPKLVEQMPGREVACIHVVSSLQH
jgi:peptide/nickel transport system ATP-binding protein